MHQCSWVYPALIVTCSSLDAQSCIDTAVPDSSCLDSLFCMHVDVIYFSMQYKARKLLGLLYRKYYQYAEPQILLQLCTSLVRPHLEYASPIWNPHLTVYINTLEDAQKFALRMCSKCWDQTYSQLLQQFNIPRLQTTSTFTLCLKFHLNFPPGIAELQALTEHIRFIDLSPALLL